MIFHIVLFPLRCERAQYPSGLNAFAEKTESISTSGNPSKGEGMDAQLEEVNKESKNWDHGSMSAKHWITIFRNHDNLLKVSETCLVK